MHNIKYLNINTRAPCISRGGQRYLFFFKKNILIIKNKTLSLQ